jgi:hypothetical protein
MVKTPLEFLFIPLSVLFNNFIGIISLVSFLLGVEVKIVDSRSDHV